MQRSFLLLTFILALISTNVIFADRVFQGHLEVIYIDNPTNPQKLHRLRFADGSKLRLKVKTNFNYKPGTLLRIKGKQTDSALVVNKVLSSDKKFSLVGSQAETNGDKKLLVVAITDSSFTETFIPYSKAELESIYFGSSFSLVDYMKKVSNSNFNVTGEVFATIGIPNLCKSDNLFERDIEEIGLQAIENFITDLDTYGFVSFVVPDRDDCLSNAAGIGTLGKLTYESAIHGDIRLGVSFVRAYNKEDFDNVVLSTAIHEFGHNLGLNHGNVNSCGREIFSTEACAGVEYGDGHGIMGTSPNISHFNMIQKEDLGWLNPSEILVINDDALKQNIKLLPISSTQSGIKMIKVRRQDGRYYSIEYRQAIGYDAMRERSFNSLNFAGFLVYLDEETIGNRPLMIDSQFEDFRVSSTLQSGFGASYYVNFDITSSMHERGLFSLNESFDDTVSDIVVSAQAFNTGAATITVNKGSAIDDGSGDEEPDPIEEPNDDSTLNARFVNPNTFGSEIKLDFKKKTKILLVIPDNPSKSRSTSYSARHSSGFKKLSRVKKNKFNLFRGATIPITLAPERIFLKRGFSRNQDGEYTISILVKERGKRASSSPVSLQLKVLSSQI